MKKPVKDLNSLDLPSQFRSRGGTQRQHKSAGMKLGCNVAFWVGFAAVVLAFVVMLLFPATAQLPIARGFPTPTTSPIVRLAESEARRIWIADGSSVNDVSLYTTLLLKTMQECELLNQWQDPYTVRSTANLIMAAGGEIEKVAPTVDVPRFKIMYMISFEKDNDNDCIIWLAGAVSLAKIEAESGTFD